jgi:hypothetical protein
MRAGGFSSCGGSCRPPAGGLWPIQSVAIPDWNGPRRDDGWPSLAAAPGHIDGLRGNLGWPVVLKPGGLRRTHWPPPGTGFRRCSRFACGAARRKAAPDQGTPALAGFSAPHQSAAGRTGCTMGGVV